MIMRQNYFSLCWLMDPILTESWKYLVPPCPLFKFLCSGTMIRYKVFNQAIYGKEAFGFVRVRGNRFCSSGYIT
jgi:hypothetical protein